MMLSRLCQCGGIGCSENPGGEEPFEECCANDVKACEVFCSESETAPCIIDDAGENDGEEGEQTFPPG